MTDQRPPDALAGPPSEYVDHALCTTTADLLAESHVGTFRVIGTGGNCAAIEIVGTFAGTVFLAPSLDYDAEQYEGWTAWLESDPQTEVTAPRPHDALRLALAAGLNRKARQ